MKNPPSSLPHSIAVWSDFCAVAPAPELRDRLLAELTKVRSRKVALSEQLGFARTPRWLGFDDGMILPPESYPVGTPEATIRAGAADRAPLRGSVKVAVVLADFSDRAMTTTTQHVDQLFFSLGVLPNGSVKEYYRDVTNNLVDITGVVVGPVRLPQTLAWYANNNFGIGRPTGTPRANIMAQDAAVLADPLIDFSTYDNDGNGMIDAFIIVHAGAGGESTGNPGDIWSHKWNLPTAHATDGGKQISGYLTIPEDAKIGVCAHELGHLLFGFPDLYDTDGSSEGIGNWCLMAGGSWGGGGDVPVHPSAWCKANQGWAAVTNVTTGGTLSLPDVKTSNTVHRLWKDGTAGSEYFLVENRQQTGYDASLPGGGLLIWHIDEAKPTNTDENHYKVALVQADNLRQLELAQNRGDTGDPYPGKSGNTSFTSSSSPNSKSYAGADTCVSITSISGSMPTMTATVAVSCGKGKELFKDNKDRKDIRKDIKEPFKERIDTKGPFKERKDVKETIKDFRDNDLRKRLKDAKDSREFKEPDRPPFDRPFDPRFSQSYDASAETGGDDVGDLLMEIIQRLEAVEASVAGAAPAEPFIGADLRPDLVGGPAYEEPGAQLIAGMASGDAASKRSYDSPPASA